MIINPSGAANLDGVKMFSTVIPKGRMRGDVDGDGRITQADADMINSFVVNSVSLDDASQWCAKVNNDTSINISDSRAIQNFLAGIGAIDFTDYYGKWTYKHENGQDPYWATTVPIPSLTNTMFAVVFVFGLWESDMFSDAKILDGTIQIESIRPPIEDVPVTIIYGPGYGNAILYKKSILTPNTIGAANKPNIVNVQLQPDGWDSDKKQVVSVNGVNEEQEKQDIRVHAYNASSAEYLRCGISVVSQGDGSLQFYAETLPEKKLFLRVIITDLT